MLAIRSNHDWIVRCPAKLNLLLEIEGRRDDGYHEIETLMVPIDLYDTLVFRPTVSNHIELSCAWASGFGGKADWLEPPPASEDNLVFRALELLRKRSDCLQGACVRLTKRIPSAAGLGGGSSDAAAALLVANSAWNLGWSRDQLAELSAELGSDIPFFFAGSAAICRGRGELVEPIPVGGRFDFVLVKPAEGHGTAAVFSRLQPTEKSNGTGPMATAVAAGDAVRVGELLGNRLQAAAEEMSPSLCSIVEEFRKLDVLGCQMTGSGTCYFGVCRNRHQARRLASRLRQRNVGEVYSVASNCCYGQGDRL